MQENQRILMNTKVKDSGGKIIFDDPILVAQFLRDYVDLPYMKNVQPEDIEDVSAQFVPLFAEERNADRVKKIQVRERNPFFVVSLIEHKTDVEYNVCMQIFRYIAYIWEVYEKEMEQKQPGISKRKDFKYPPVLPIVYYEGSKRWTAPLDFKSRINHGEVFAKYVPDFQYYLVPVHGYTNEELLEKADEISLVMLINKLQTKADVEEFRRISPERLEAILSNTPPHLLSIIANVLMAFLLKENVPVEEAENLAGKVKEKKMAELFANMEHMDIQAERHNTNVQRQRAERAEERAEQAEKRAEQAEERAVKVERELAEEKRKYEETVKSNIEAWRDSGLSREEILDKLMEGIK